MSDHPSKIRPSDLEKFLEKLSVSSTSPEEVKSTLKNLWNFSSESEDCVVGMLTKGAVNVLVSLYKRSNENSTKAIVICILVLLGQKASNNVGFVVDCLAGIFVESEFSIFIQCLNGIKEITSAPAPSSSPSPASSKSEPPAPTTSSRSLSVVSASALFTKVTSLLNSTAVSNSQKLEALDTFMELVESAALNEAAEFSVWAHDKSKEKGKNAEDAPSQLFFSAFAAFSDALNKIASEKKKVSLCFTTEQIYNLIKENKFFPTSVIIPVSGSSTTNLPLKFMASTKSFSYITLRTDTKITLGNTSSQWVNFFVDQEMVERFYKLTIKVSGSYSSDPLSWTYLGLSHKSQLSTASEYSSSGTAFYGWNNVYCGGSSAYNGSIFSRSQGHLFALELDIDKGVLHLFVDGVQVPHSVVNIPKSVFFAIVGHIGETFELQSLQKLAAPTVNPSQASAQYGWK